MIQALFTNALTCLIKERGSFFWHVFSASAHLFENFQVPLEWLAIWVRKGHDRVSKHA